MGKLCAMVHFEPHQQKHQHNKLEYPYMYISCSYGKVAAKAAKKASSQIVLEGQIKYKPNCKNIHSIWCSSCN